MAVTFTYPTSTWVFASDITILAADGLDAGAEVDFTIGDYLDKRYADTSGHCELDISQYLQSMFSVKGSGVATTYQAITFSIESGDNLVEHGLGVVYGATYPGDDPTPHTTSTHWWVNLPQQYFWLREHKYQAYARKDGEVVGDDLDIETVGVASIDLASKIGDNDELYEVYQRASSGEAAEAPAYIRYYHEFIKHEDTDGLYLRWLDRFGCYQYWLFDKGSEEYSNSVYGEQLDVQFSYSDSIYKAQQYQGKEMATSIGASAPLVDNDTFKFLLHLVCSPNVCLYDADSQSWIPVTVSASKNTWAIDKHAHLQDFEISIVLPQYTTSKL